MFEVREVTLSGYIDIVVRKIKGRAKKHIRPREEIALGIFRY